MIKWNLPPNWEWRQLSILANDTERRNPKHTPDEIFHYVDISSVDNEVGAIDLSKVKEMQGRQAPSRARKVILTNDIIFATTRPYLRNIALVPQVLDNEICSTGFCVIRANQEICDPQYLYYAARSQVVINQLLPKQRGANYPAVTDSDVFASQIPVPHPNEPERSLAEQKNIVSRIVFMLTELQEMQSLNHKIKEDTQNVMSSVLAEAFPSLYSPMPGGWSIKSVLEIAQKPQYGHTESAQDSPIGPKFLRITDIQNGKVDWETVPFCLCDEQCVQKYQLEDGDIVFARSGATTGKTYLVQNPPEKAVFASYLIRLKSLDDVLPKFLYWFFQSPEYWQQITPIGAAIPNVNATTLKKVRVPVPESRAEQERIANYFDLIQAELEEMQQINQEDEESLRVMETAILSQAFQGEL